MEEGEGDQGDEQVIAIANSLVGGVAYVVEMVVVSSYVHSRSVYGVGDICKVVVGNICDGVMGLGKHQHKSVLSMGKDHLSEPALSRDR